MTFNVFTLQITNNRLVRTSILKHRENDSSILFQKIVMANLVVNIKWKSWNESIVNTQKHYIYYNIINFSSIPNIISLESINRQRILAIKINYY